MPKKDNTTKDLELRARRVKMEMDTLEIATHGMTFDELIRLLAPGAARQPLPPGKAGAQENNEEEESV